MYRKALTSDSLSTHGFFWAKTSRHPLYCCALGRPGALLQIRGALLRIYVVCLPSKSLFKRLLAGTEGVTDV